MYPELFKIGPLTVYSFGFMLGLSFIVASFILSKEYKRGGLNDTIASEITMISLIFGVIGSKLLDVFENWGEFSANIWSRLFSPGGLTFYGGLILVCIVIFIYCRRKKIPIRRLTDLTAPSLAIAYGIGRIGCHLAGDGDYGIPTKLPWGVNYENGVVKPMEMFRGSDIAKSFPGGFVPNNTPLHPTPIYEFLGALVIFGILWYYRKKNLEAGRLFMIYLMLSSLARFLVEFIRLNPNFAFGMTEAQFISVVLFVGGLSGFFYLKGKVAPPMPVFKPKAVKKAKERK